VSRRKAAGLLRFARNDEWEELIMLNGCDYLIRLKTKKADTVIPFLSKTLREKIFFCEEYAPIEGEGWRGGITENAGTEGGFTTALTLESAPAILGAVFGKQKSCMFVSGTRDIYQYRFVLCASDSAMRFYLHEMGGETEKVYPDCVCAGFELRIERDEAVKVHIDIDGGGRAETFNAVPAVKKTANIERFNERGAEYFIDGKKYNSIYRFVLSCDKKNGCRTEVLIYRYLTTDNEPPAFIENLTIRANLFRDMYGENQHGKFAVTLTDLRLLSDDTEVCAADAVIGGLRYSVGGVAFVDAFMSGMGAYDEVLSD
jgi:hypothetical protein